VQRLADLNGAVTKAKTERIDRESEYNRLLSMKSDRQALEAFPAILSNTYVTQLKTEIANLQRQQAQLAARYGERHPEMVNATTQLKSAEAKLQVEIDSIMESVRGEFLTAPSARKEPDRSARVAEGRGACEQSPRYRVRRPRARGRQQPPAL
jgi:uncharacterized protein involved in exopolysaccharide biosynthesis